MTTNEFIPSLMLVTLCVGLLLESGSCWPFCSGAVTGKLPNVSC
jgi:hypothetical protein